MSPQHNPPAHRKGMRRAVVALPNGFTLGNLFCGIYAIVLSSRGGAENWDKATFYIVLGGIADVLDGRVARATGTGSRFGEELDSLVDAISFGLAPALMMYFAVLHQDGWDWIFAFIFTAFAVSRLARFNVEQAGRAKTHFHGLPSPAAGMTLASYYWFSQTPLYNQTLGFFADSHSIAAWPWHKIMPGLMMVLAYLMWSDVPYPAVPSIGFRNPRQWIGTLLVVGSIVGLFVAPHEFIFPALLAYVIFGLGRAIVVGFVGKRRGSIEAAYWDEDEPNGDEEPPRRKPESPKGSGSAVMIPATRSAVDPERSEASERPERPERQERVERSRGQRPAASSSDDDAPARRRKRRRRPPRGNAPPSSPDSGPSAAPPPPSRPDTP